MADTLYFSRNTKCYITDSSGNTVFEIPILDGYSFTQGMDTQEISLSEATSTRRGRQVFNNMLQPGEWSLQTYIRPFTEGASDYASGHKHLVEEALWAHLVGTGVFDTSAKTFANCTADGTDLDISFSNSNVAQLGEFTMVFVLEPGDSREKIYTLAKCVVNEVTIDFDIEGIATASWSGFFQTLTESGTDPGDATHLDDGVDSTTNYIANKLSTCVVAATGDQAGLSALTYDDIALTGGSITISNNISYLTPNTLGSVNTPLGHVTGTRTVSGNLTMYLSDDGSNSIVDLFEDSTSVTQDFTLDIKIGGATGNRLELDMNNVHLEVPSLSFDDIISVDVAFHALPATLDATDEINNIKAGV